MTDKIVRIGDCNKCPHYICYVGHDGGFGNNVRRYAKCGVTGNKLEYTYEHVSNCGFPDWCPLEDAE